MYGDCTPVCRVDLHRCKCSGTNLLSAGLAKQHRRTRHAVDPKHCSSALVVGDCTPLCRVDLQRCKCHRCKCKGTRLMSAGLAQQHRRAGHAVDPKHRSSALVIGDCTPVCRVHLHRWKCSGTRLLSAGLAHRHRRTSLYEERTLEGVTAVAQGCCTAAQNTRLAFCREHYCCAFTPGVCKSV